MMTIYSAKDGFQLFSLSIGDRGSIASSICIPPGYSRLDEEVFKQLCTMYPKYFTESDQGVDQEFRPNADKIRKSTTDNFLKQGMWSFERQISEAEARELWGADLGMDFALLCNVVYFANSDGAGGQTLLHAVTMVHRDRATCIYFGLGGKLIGELKSTAEDRKISWLIKPAEWVALCKSNAPKIRAE